MGVSLDEPTFTHGQLNDAASRLADLQHLHFAVNNSVSRKTRNVVYKEFLLTGEVVSIPTEGTLSCSLLNSDQPWGAVDL